MTTRTVRRFDAGQLRKAEVTPEGFLRAPALLTRVGVFEYVDASGKITRELRRPEQVFDADSLRSFSLLPVTDEHPAAGCVTADTARELQRGSIGEIVERDGDFMKTTIMITDRALVRKVLDGDAAEISNGYSCVVVDSAGEWNGQRYDCEQTMIRGNHVAVVPRGRAGPAARVKLDAQDAVAIPRRDDVAERPHAKETPMKKIKIHGIEFEVPEQVCDALEAERAGASAAAQARVDAAAAGVTAKDGEIARQTARADAAEAEVKKIKGDADALRAAQPKLVNDALVVIDVARRAGVEVKLDALDLPALRRAVAEKVLGLKLDGKSAEYVDASFDLAKAKVDDAPTGANLLEVVDPKDEKGKGKNDADEDPRAAMVKRNADAWKTGGGK